MGLKIYILATIVLTFIILSPNLISAEIQVGASGNIGVDLNIPTPINYTEKNVNNSIYWNGHSFSYLASNYVPYSGATSLVNLGAQDLLADLVWANDMQIWDDTLNADAILSMYTHDLSNSFTLEVNDAGSTDFYSAEQYQFRSGDNLFQIIHDMYTGTYLNINVGNTFPEITAKDDVISFVDNNLTTTGNITADYFFGNWNGSSDYVLKAGDTMTGNLNISNANLYVSGDASSNGTWLGIGTREPLFTNAGLSINYTSKGNDAPSYGVTDEYAGYFKNTILTTEDTHIGYYGFRADIKTDPTNTFDIGPASSVRGLYALASHYGSGTVTNLQGIRFSARLYGDGNVGAIYGLTMSNGLRSGSTGNASTMYGVYVYGSASGEGTLTNNYHLYVAPLTSAKVVNNYGLYIGEQGGTGNVYSIYTGTAPSYFGGNVTAPYYNGVNVSNLVPYTGATSNVDLGNNNLYSNNFFINYTGGSMYIGEYDEGSFDLTYHQTAIGVRAGRLSTGDYQTAVGYRAGQSNTGGYQLAFGTLAGENNTGEYQTVFGGNTGSNNVADYQTAMGTNAGVSNTGLQQVAIGSSAGKNNIGDRQTAVGTNAGFNNTGIKQQVFGNSAGYKNTGNYQTSFGIYAGYENTGDRITTFGYSAGDYNTAHNITGIGYEALASNSGSNTIAIGYQAGKSNTLNNQFIIKQANINAIPLIQGNFSSGYLGIGTISPQNKLNVIGDINFTGLIYGNGSQLTGLTLTESDPYWTANYSAYNESWSAGSSDTNETARFDNLTVNDCSAGYLMIGVYDNGTVKCAADSGAGAESDPKWSANYTAYNDSWSIDTNTWDTSWLANWTAYNTTWSAGGEETLWNANYSDFLDISAWNDTGLIQDWDPNNYIKDWNASGWIKNQSSSGLDATWVANWTAYNTTWSQDTTYSDLSEFNDDILWTTTFNATGDTKWTTETYVNLQNTSMKNYVDGTFISTELDPKWSANYTAYNESWSLDTNTWDTSWFSNWTAYNTTWGTDTTYSQGTNMSFDGTTINWDGSWVESIFAKLVDLAEKVSWTDLWNQVYNETEVDAINTSMKNYVDSQDIVYNDSMKSYVDATSGGGGGASVGNTKTQVWTATNCPTTWTDIDLSGTVGSNSALVHISFQSTAGDMNSISIRANGDTTEYHEKTAEVSAYGIAVGHHDSGGTATGGALILSSFTDNNGVIEWICETSKEADAYLLGWVG